MRSWAPRASWVTLLAFAVASHGCERRSNAGPPKAFYRIEWRPVLLPLSAAPGARIPAQVTFRNLGGETWPGNGRRAPRQVCLAHRWLAEGGDPWTQGEQGALVPLPRPLRPGEWATLPVELIAPTSPGDYIVQFDLEHVGVGFFALRGAAKKLILLRVGEPTDEPAHAASDARR